MQGPKKVPTFINPVGDASTSERFTQLSNFYVFAEKLEDIGAKNAIVQKTIEIAKRKHMEVNPVRDTVNIIYEGTLVDSIAGLLLVDIFTDTGTDTWLGNKWDAPKAFLPDLALDLLDRRRPPNDDTVFACGPYVYMENLRVESVYSSGCSHIFERESQDHEWGSRK